jgi:hypothetical protein
MYLNFRRVPFFYIRDGSPNWFKIYDAHRITTWNTFCLFLLTIRKIVKTKQCMNIKLVLEKTFFSN